MQLNVTLLIVAAVAALLVTYAHATPLPPARVQSLQSRTGGPLSQDHLEARTWPPTSIFSDELARIGDLDLLTGPYVMSKDSGVAQASKDSGAAHPEPDGPIADVAEPLQRIETPPATPQVFEPVPTFKRPRSPVQQHYEAGPSHSTPTTSREVPRKSSKSEVSEMTQVFRLFQVNPRFLKHFRPLDHAAWQFFEDRWLDRVNYAKASGMMLPRPPSPFVGETPQEYAQRLYREFARVEEAYWKSSKRRKL